MLEPLHTDNSPFTEPQLRELNKGINTLDHAQTMWLSGYLAGRLINASALPATADTAVHSEFEFNILYGSDTGNGKAIASQLADSATATGLSVKLQSLADLRPAALKKMQQAVFVISTHGDGDPPDDALDVFEYLGDLDGDALKGLQYRVLALGDRSYNEFCAAGRTLDGHLERLAASRFGVRIECDLDYDKDVSQWTELVDMSFPAGQSNLELHTSRDRNNCTMDSQQTVIRTLGEPPAMAMQCSGKSPGLFIIGQVASLGGRLAWFNIPAAMAHAA